MFIRIKTINNAKYAYLVESVWNKGKTQQKVKQYLGKIIFSKTTPKIEAPNFTFNNEQTPSENIEKLITFFYTQLEFELKKGEYIYYPDKIKKQKYIKIGAKVLNHLSKPACFEINEGFLCTPTLKELRLLPYAIKNAEKKAEHLAHTLLGVGINLSKELFIELYGILLHEDKNSK
jgi:hypothetical protein